MGLFELLIILFFIVIPIINGIQKQRRKSQGPGPEAGQGGAPRQPGTTGEEPQAASDMVPADLWELLTGEKRPTGEGAPVETGPDATEDRGVEPWETEEDVEPEPVYAEYRGPEAYTLETPAPEPRSLEDAVPSPEARHRAFHALIDRPQKERRTAATPLIRSLRSREGLRQAVLFKEILGKPKGLE